MREENKHGGAPLQDGQVAHLKVDEEQKIEAKSEQDGF